MATVRNDRSGETITDDLTHAQAAALFAQGFGDRDHWLWFWVHRYARDVRPVQPVTAPQVANEQAAGRAALNFLADLFLLAIGRGLKRPMIRCHFRDRRFKLYLSPKGTVCIKSGGLTAPAEDGSRDPVGDEEYVGCLLGGRFLIARQQPVITYGPYRGYRGRRNYNYEGQNNNDRNRPERPLLPVEREFLDNLLGPECISFLAKCSKDMDRCCYCNNPLDDVRSKTLGYGPTCAKSWDLPWGHEKDIQHMPSFSSLYCADIAQACVAIREQLDDPIRWAVLNDWLTERGCTPLKIVEQVPITEETREDGTAGTWRLKWNPSRLARTN